MKKIFYITPQPQSERGFIIGGKLSKELDDYLWKARGLLGGPLFALHDLAGKDDSDYMISLPSHDNWDDLLAYAESYGKPNSNDYDTIIHIKQNVEAVMNMSDKTIKNLGFKKDTGNI